MLSALRDGHGLRKKRYICILIPPSSHSKWRMGSRDVNFNAPDEILPRQTPQIPAQTILVFANDAGFLVDMDLNTRVVRT